MLTVFDEKIKCIDTVILHMICYIIIWDGLMIGAYSPEKVWVRPSRFCLSKRTAYTVRIAAYRVQGAYTHNNPSPDVAYMRQDTSSNYRTRLGL